MDAAQLLFRGVLPRQVLWARLTAKLGRGMSDMTFRQNGQHTVILRLKTVPFGLCYDVIEGSSHPKLNGYQRPLPGCACGINGLGMFAQRGWGVQPRVGRGLKPNYSAVGTAGLRAEEKFLQQVDDHGRANKGLTVERL